jgi:hypothetical protein
MTQDKIAGGFADLDRQQHPHLFGSTPRLATRRREESPHEPRNNRKEHNVGDTSEQDFHPSACGVARLDSRKQDGTHQYVRGV